MIYFYFCFYLLFFSSLSFAEEKEGTKAPNFVLDESTLDSDAVLGADEAEKKRGTESTTICIRSIGSRFWCSAWGRCYTGKRGKRREFITKKLY